MEICPCLKTVRLNLRTVEGNYPFCSACYREEKVRKDAERFDIPRLALRKDVVEGICTGNFKTCIDFQIYKKDHPEEFS